MRIGDREVGAGQPPYLIAEMSGNHNGSLETALSIVDAAAESGADAVKLQTYTADSMTLNIDHPDFVINNPDSLWRGRRIYELYEEAHTPWEWHEPIFKRAAEHGMHCFSSPFSAEAVDFLVDLGAPCLKIASLESVDHALVKYAAQSGLPLIISTGLCTAEEIQESIDAARAGGCEDPVILKCTSSYPTDPSESNLNTIADMRDRFGVDVGLSDHTLGIGVPLAAIAHGAVVVEKHFTVSRAAGGVDSAFSLEPQEFTALTAEADRAHRSMGSVSYGPTPGENGALLRRRSLYFVADLDEGDIILPEHVRSIRPNKGLPPKHLGTILGSRTTRSVAYGTPVSWDAIAIDRGAAE